jgi:hypothetical protein
MKNRILTIFLLITLTGFMVSGQVEEEPYQGRAKSDEMKTLFSRGNTIGGYGELSMLYSQINSRDAFTFGARGGVLLGHIMTLGLCGSGFFTDKYWSEGIQDNITLAGGYGGLFFEPILMPRWPVHLAFPVTVGVGGIAAAQVNDYIDDDDDNHYYLEESDAYMLVEPGVELELNITKFFRFSIGGYYRYTTNVDLNVGTERLPSDVLRGFSAGINFKFGKF